MKSRPACTIRLLYSYTRFLKYSVLSRDKKDDQIVVVAHRLGMFQYLCRNAVATNSRRSSSASSRNGQPLARRDTGLCGVPLVVAAVYEGGSSKMVIRHSNRLLVDPFVSSVMWCGR